VRAALANRGDPGRSGRSEEVEVDEQEAAQRAEHEAAALDALADELEAAAADTEPWPADDEHLVVEGWPA